MPYIKPEGRKKYDKLVDKLSLIVAAKYRGNIPVGDMNYCVTRFILGVLRSNGTNYNNLNALIGMTECVKQELYRMQAAPYEDKKKEENGGVFYPRWEH